MEHQEIEEAIHEFAQFASVTGKAMQNHLQQLQRHELILEQEYKAGASHHVAIMELRELVAAQGQLLQSTQRVLLKITTSLGIAPDEPPQSDQIN
jgi:hypothetical protein